MSFIILILTYEFLSNYACSVSNVNVSGNKDWLEGGTGWMSIVDDKNLNGKLDLIVFPQYGRNPDHTG